MNAFTKKDLIEMWKRPVERQYNIAMTKIFEAIKDTGGDISICFSGGKDSALLLDMYCETVSQTAYRDKPVQVYFANTTNETKNMISFIHSFIPWVEEKYGVTVDFHKVRPSKNLVWVNFVRDNGIPLISKAQSKAIRTVKQDMKNTGCDFDTVLRLAKPEMSCVNELQDIGFSKTGILSLTGYVSSRQCFGKMFTLSKKWFPMLKCDIDLTEQCCVKIKEEPLRIFTNMSMMTGEQANESASREVTYLKRGCNARLPNGKYRSTPLGAMTKDGVLFALKYRQTPICADYGEIVCENGHYCCTKSQRTGCALCGFGCQYDTERFVRLQETEPAKVAFAFTPKSKGGAGYREAIEFMNEFCGTKVLIPQVD